MYTVSYKPKSDTSMQSANQTLKCIPCMDLMYHYLKIISQLYIDLQLPIYELPDEVVKSHLYDCNCIESNPSYQGKKDMDMLKVLSFSFGQQY